MKKTLEIKGFRLFKYGGLSFSFGKCSFLIIPTVRRGQLPDSEFLFIKVSLVMLGVKASLNISSVATCYPV